MANDNQQSDSPLTEEECKLLEYFRSLNSKGRDFVMETAILCVDSNLYKPGRRIDESGNVVRIEF